MFFFHHPNYRHEKDENGAEIKSLRPDDVLFPLFPMQNSIPKSIILRRMEKGLNGEKSGGGGEERIWPQI